MDPKNLESCVSQPDVCRCCLSTIGVWDMYAKYVSETGVNEVYSDMLQECFGINLSSLTEWGPSTMLCSLCVGHIKDACMFKKQVIEAEKYFVQYIDNEAKRNMLHDAEGDFNVEAVINNDFTLSDDITPDCEDEIKELIKKSHRLSKPGCKKIKNLKVNKKKRQIDDSLDNLSIAELSRQCYNGKERIEGDQVQGEDKDINEHFPIQNLTHVNGAKQLSERKRVILTCEVILKNTTACPFRHHKSWFQCFYCTQDFIELDDLRYHTSEKHSNVDEELKHMKRYPKSLQIEISNLECRHCSLNLTDVDSMRRHFDETHQKHIYPEFIADYKLQ